MVQAMAVELVGLVHSRCYLLPRPVAWPAACKNLCNSGWCEHLKNAPVKHWNCVWVCVDEHRRSPLPRACVRVCGSACLCNQVIHFMDFLHPCGSPAGPFCAGGPASLLLLGFVYGKYELGLGHVVFLHAENLRKRHRREFESDNYVKMYYSP